RTGRLPAGRGRGRSKTSPATVGLTLRPSERNWSAPARWHEGPRSPGRTKHVKSAELNPSPVTHVGFSGQDVALGVSPLDSNPEAIRPSGSTRTLAPERQAQRPPDTRRANREHLD